MLSEGYNLVVEREIQIRPRIILSRWIGTKSTSTEDIY
jgi:hypothetical protein